MERLLSLDFLILRRTCSLRGGLGITTHSKLDRDKLLVTLRNHRCPDLLRYHSQTHICCYGSIIRIREAASGGLISIRRYHHCRTSEVCVDERNSGRVDYTHEGPILWEFASENRCGG